jgi:hypothetical protein
VIEMKGEGNYIKIHDVYQNDDLAKQIELDILQEEVDTWQDYLS